MKVIRPTGKGSRKATSATSLDPGHDTDQISRTALMERVAIECARSEGEARLASEVDKRVTELSCETSSGVVSTSDRSVAASVKPSQTTSRIDSDSLLDLSLDHARSRDRKISARKRLRMRKELE